MADVDHIEMEFTVEPNYAGWRLDRYLCAKIRRLSRTHVQSIIERELISDAPEKLKASTLVTAGMTFKLRRKALPEPEVPAAEEVREVFRDDWLLILDKPAGLPIHPTARYHHGTLVSQLKARGEEAWPAHRLDRETSGVLLFARSREVCDLVQAGWSSVAKTYLAIVEGHVAPPEGIIDLPVKRGLAASVWR